jgi:hypothetical protein
VARCHPIFINLYKNPLDSFVSLCYTLQTMRKG